MATSLTLRTIAAQSMTLRSVDPVSLTLNAPVAGITPSIDGVPTISGTPKVGSTLTATAATSSGLPTPTDTFQWQRSDDGSTGWANISGAVNTTYTAVSADEGKYLRVVQTSTNEVGSDTANSASTAQVAAEFDYLLDDYSDAAAAYSLRLLSSTYSGSAIRVRRSDDNEEQDIGFRNNELDTSTLETFSLGSDCFVVTWYDQSGSNNATQATASAQPKIVSSGSTILENGKPTIEFDNINDFLKSNTVFGTNTSIFSVFKNNDTQGVIFSGTNSSSDYLYAFRINNGGIASGLTVSSTYKNATLQSLSNQTSVYNAINTANQLLWSSFLTSVTISRYSNLQIGSSVLGGTSFNWSEIVLYASDESTNRSGIETNINDFYSIF